MPFSLRGFRISPLTLPKKKIPAWLQNLRPLTVTEIGACHTPLFLLLLRGAVHAKHQDKHQGRRRRYQVDDETDMLPPAVPDSVVLARHLMGFMASWAVLARRPGR